MTMITLTMRAAFGGFMVGGNLVCSAFMLTMLDGTPATVVAVVNIVTALINAGYVYANISDANEKDFIDERDFNIVVSQRDAYCKALSEVRQRP